MKFWINIFVTFALVASSQMSAFGQSQSKADHQGEQKIVLGTTEVVLDVVVRDKKGRPVRDLKASDFEVLEDGVRQQVESFRLVVREPETGGAGIKTEVKKEEATARQPASRDPFAEAS